MIVRGAAFVVLFLALSHAMGAVPGSSGSWFAREWQTDDGLPDSAVTGVVQTPDGYLWVSTHSGLARFDGEQFTLRPLPLAADRFNPLARVLLLDKRGTLWVGIESGEGLLIGLGPTETNIFKLGNYRPTSLAETPDGTIWAGYAEGTIISFSRSGMKRYGPREGLPGSGQSWVGVDGEDLWFTKGTNAGTIKEGKAQTRFTLPDQRIRLAPARQGGLWIWTGRRLLRYVNGQAPGLIAEMPFITGIPEPSIVFEDSAGGVWLGTRSSGLFHWDGQSLLPVETTHRNINSLLQDREGNIWVSTEGGGLNRLRQRVLELHGLTSGLGFETARSVCEDDRGDLWAVGLDGTLAHFADSHWTTISNLPAGAETRVTCVVGDGSGGIWAGTYRHGLLHRWNGEFKTLGQGSGLGVGSIRALFVDSRKDLWIGLEGPTSLQRLRNGTFETLTLPPGSRSIASFAEDPDGSLWVGALSGELVQIQDGVVVSRADKVLQPSKSIRTLKATPEGLWIGYSGAGIGWLRGGKFSRFDMASGLPEDNICGIEQDSHGAFWFNGSRSIFRLVFNDFAEAAAQPERTLQPMVFGRNEGVANLHGSYGAWPNSLRARDGKVWFTARSGLVAISPGRIQTNSHAPLVLIESFLVDGREQGAGHAHTTIRLPPAHRRLDFHAVGLNFAAPEAVLFRYRIKGWEESWSAPGRAREFTLSRLPAGDYEFQVTACNSAGLWNSTGATLSFSVEPFLWQRWWFRLTAFLLLGACSVGIVRFVSLRRLRARVKRLEQETSVQRDRVRIARDLHDDLGSSLTEISFLAGLEPGDNDATELRARFDNIVERTRRMTRSLDEIVWAVNPANDTLKATANYLCSRAQEYLRSADVRCRLEVQRDLPDLTLPSEMRHNLLMIVVEAVNNVIKHAQASEVTLHVTKQADQLTVRIQDNGKGFDKSMVSPERNGLVNMQRRSEAIGGRLEVVSAGGRGTSVTLRLPLR